MNDPRSPMNPAQPAHPVHHPHTGASQGMPQGIPRPAANTGMSGSAAPGAPRPLVSPRPAAAPSQNLPRTGSAPVINPAAPSKQLDEDAISLVDDDSDTTTAAPAAPSKIKFGADITHRTHEWKRQLTQGGTGACRVRTFHGKLSDQGLEYIDDAINVWLDAHADVNVKFVTTNVGLFDGKFKDLALIVNVWY